MENNKPNNNSSNENDNQNNSNNNNEDFSNNNQPNTSTTKYGDSCGCCSAGSWTDEYLSCFKPGCNRRNDHCRASPGNFLSNRRKLWNPKRELRN